MVRQIKKIQSPPRQTLSPTSAVFGPLRIQRLLLGWRQSDLADRLGVTVNAVSLFERGRLTPSKRLRQRIAEVFGLPVDELFPGAPGGE